MTDRILKMAQTSFPSQSSAGELCRTHVLTGSKLLQWSWSKQRQYVINSIILTPAHKTHNGGTGFKVIIMAIVKVVINCYKTAASVET